MRTVVEITALHAKLHIPLPKHQPSQMNGGAIVVQLVQRPVPVLKAQVLQSESGESIFTAQ